ncbi:DNA-primase RepB domain-containing protein [Roseomonas sp. GCM10028921]
MPLTTDTARRGGDRTLEALQRWARALPAPHYAVTAVPADAPPGSPTHRRLWDPSQLMRAVPWLRRLNARGFHIVGRPVAARHILVDDITPDALEALCREHRPAAVVRSSPGSLQAWLTVSETPVEPSLADAVAKCLARRYGGDLCAARASQPGRLPGFTNRKRKHQAPGGLYPYALLVRAERPVVDPGGAALLKEAGALVRQAVAASPPTPPAPRATRLRSPAEEHATGAARVRASLPPGLELDRSRLDFAVARRLLARGVSAAEVTAVLLAGERAASMRASAAQDYVRRTVRAAGAMTRPPDWALRG